MKAQSFLLVTVTSQDLSFLTWFPHEKSQKRFLQQLFKCATNC